MLYKGNNRLYSNIFSITFLKTIIMTATKFLIQSSILSIAIKSLMFKFVSKWQYFAPHTEDTAMFRELEEYYYRGLCLSDPDKPEHFCSFQEVLTFTEATLIIPLFMIAVLYVPSVFYITAVSLKFYGLARWWPSVLADPVCFIFPIFTCISFYHRNDNLGGKKSEEEQSGDITCQNDGALQESMKVYENKSSNADQDSSGMMDIIEMDIETQNVEKAEKEQNDIEAVRPIDVKGNFNNSKQFSVYQSNVLYFLFFTGAALCIGGDIFIQYVR